MEDLYRLYIDESGDHHYHDYSKPKYNKPSERYLGLMGVAMRKDVRQQVHVKLENLKRDHFDSDPDDPVILHRKEIIHKQGAFSVLRDPMRRKTFNNDLIDFLNTLECVLFIIVIDKKYHIDTYGKSAYHPYHYALTAMLERYCGYLNFINSRGDVWAEQRGKKEDRELEKVYSRVFDSGTYFRGASFFQRALTTRKIKIKSKKANIAGLQIADILAHPCKQELLYEKGRMSRQPSAFGRQIYNSVKYKYNMQVYRQQIEGYGKVLIGE